MNMISETLDEAILRFAQNIVNKGYQHEATHEYKDLDGKIIYWRLRFKNHATGEKYIRPMQQLEDGSFIMKEPDFTGKKPLYNMFSLLNVSNVDVVYVVEGEKCVDAFTRLGMIAVTSGAASSVEKADWQLLTGKKVIIWPDNDEPGRQFLTAVIETLIPLNCELWQVNINALNLPAKGDVVDWLMLNPEASAQDLMKLPVTKAELELVEQSPNDTEKAQNKRENLASILVNFVTDRAELFHDMNRGAYARDHVTNATRKIGSHQFKTWLSSNYFGEYQRVPNEQSIREAMNALDGIAILNGDCHAVYIRVAKHNDSYYVDLAIPNRSDAICITPKEWKIVDSPPVRFLRPESMQSLPMPVSGGDLSILWRLINIQETQRVLVLTWIIEALRPDTPFTLLELVGEQGSAKSTTQALLRRLFDPNACNLRAAPKKVEDVFVTAGINWLVSYENVSHLSADIQDAFCILTTGGGYAKRKLYSDSDETIISVKRPVVLNGISASITAQDLVDRTISVETPMITDRMEADEIMRIYETEYPRLFGAILDIYSKALAVLPNIQLPSNNYSRLIEYVRLGMAVAQVFGYKHDEFLNPFKIARSESIARTIDASPVALALIELFEKGGKQTISCALTVLLERLERIRSQRVENWPRTAKGLGDALRRLAPALRQVGIACTSLGKKGSYVFWEISKCD